MEFWLQFVNPVRDHLSVMGHPCLSLEMKGPKLATDMGSRLMTRCWITTAVENFIKGCSSTSSVATTSLFLLFRMVPEILLSSACTPIRTCDFVSAYLSKCFHFPGHAETILSSPFNHNLIYLYRSSKATKLSTPLPKIISLV